MPMMVISNLPRLATTGTLLYGIARGSCVNLGWIIQGSKIPRTDTCMLLATDTWLIRITMCDFRNTSGSSIHTQRNALAALGLCQFL